MNKNACYNCQEVFLKKIWKNHSDIQRSSLAQIVGIMVAKMTNTITFAKYASQNLSVIVVACGQQNIRQSLSLRARSRFSRVGRLC